MEPNYPYPHQQRPASRSLASTTDPARYQQYQQYPAQAGGYAPAQGSSYDPAYASYYVDEQRRAAGQSPHASASYPSPHAAPAPPYGGSSPPPSGHAYAPPPLSPAHAAAPYPGSAAPSPPSASAGRGGYQPPPSPEIERFPCDKCDKTFSRAHDRKRHYESQHAAHPYLHKCRYCLKEFSRADSLKRHVDNGCEKDPSYDHGGAP
ncbi:hypothetical protein PHLGIDRAFT_13845 [Phlebiopsis gigantea 11061_1 CR5-6]|uniref:C2H2-type domain-containing protein n=1 Tax=Phlebiopsis gigantea (strain 11061_1 CR5-6) TaxID=745531 RepID=A0A0C3RXF4_PHLG1|nr:hypothetical protein PHLGIDRAFT_13845 [Phlebiopsis gigantea 11061_1 CR5-6]